MQIYTIIYCVISIAGLGIAIEQGLKPAVFISFLMEIPLIGRVFGWW